MCVSSSQLLSTEQKLFPALLLEMCHGDLWPTCASSSFFQPKDIWIKEDSCTSHYPLHHASFQLLNNTRQTVTYFRKTDEKKMKTRYVTTARKPW